jgi:hypothetical protein
MGLLQILTGSGALALVGLSLAMARFDELKAAYWLFWAAGTVATIGGLWYEFTTLDPAPIRIGSGLIAGVGVFVFLPMLFRWLKRIQVKDGTASRDISRV